MCGHMPISMFLQKGFNVSELISSIHHYFRANANMVIAMCMGGVALFSSPPAPEQKAYKVCFLYYMDEKI